MLSVNNNSNYSPSFGYSRIAKNPETKALLKACSEDQLIDILGFCKKLRRTKNFNGLVKTVDNKLAFRITIPKKFKFPVADGESIPVRTHGHHNVYGESLDYYIGHLSKNGDVYTFSSNRLFPGQKNSLPVLELRKVENTVDKRNKNIEYDLSLHSFFDYTSAAEIIKEVDKNILEYVSPEERKASLLKRVFSWLK